MAVVRQLIVGVFATLLAGITTVALAQPSRAAGTKSDGVQDDHGDGEGDQAEQLGRRETDEQPALLAIGSRRIAQRAVEELAEHETNADCGSARANRRETGANELCRSDIHD